MHPVRGELLGRAVTHGEITESALPAARVAPVDIPATFISDTKLGSACSRPSEHPAASPTLGARAPRRRR